MTPEETRILLSEIASVDNRKLTPESVRTWANLLAGFTLPECQQALRTFRRNRPDDWLVPGHIAQTINRDAQRTGHHSRQCVHGIPLGAWCHDCTHDDACTMCAPIPGVSDTPANRTATVQAFARQVQQRSA